MANVWQDDGRLSGADGYDFRKVAALMGCSAILLGAFGAHGLKERVTPYQLDSWKTAASYQLAHSVALLAAANSASSKWPGLLWTVGTTLFSGSIYALVAPALQWKVGIVTPIGGLLMAGGWLALLF